MAHIKQVRSVKYLKPIPCAICNRADNISEYMLSKERSFLYCETCKVGAEAGSTYDEAVSNWDMLMRSKEKTSNAYFDWLEGHADLEDKWWRS